MSKIGRIHVKGDPNRAYSLGLQYRLVSGPIHDDYTWGIWDRYTGEVAEVVYHDNRFVAPSVASKRHHALTGASETPDAETIAAMDAEA